jgi:hypothetical protein
MVELVDTQDLKSCDLKSRAGSIPALSTNTKLNPCGSSITGVFSFDIQLNIQSTRHSKWIKRNSWGL